EHGGVRLRSVLKSVSARRSSGISRGGGRAEASGSRAAAASRRWRSMRTRFWRWPLNSRTGPSKSSSWPCISGEYRAAAARCGVFWSDMASASKKSLRAAEQQREDVARARRHWIRQQRLLDTSSLVFIDETWVNTTMARLYGRGPRGERVIGRVPLGPWKSLTFVAGLRRDEMTAPLVIEGAMNGETFLSYITPCLAPTLKPGDIVVMDNLKAHKVAGI